MLDLPSSAAARPPDSCTATNRLHAPMPGAALCLLDASGLRDCADASLTPLSPRLWQALADLPAASSATYIAEDEQAAEWRLRRLGSAQSSLWLLQSIAHSRRNILRSLRTCFAARLATSLQHELRNPLNALGLHCDLLERNLKSGKAEAPQQAASRIPQMKERLRDLLERQNALVGLWLAEIGSDGTPPMLAVLVDETLRLLRSYGSQQEIRLQAEQLELLDDRALPSGNIELRLVLIAVVMAAFDAHPRLDAAPTIRLSALHTELPDHRLALEVQTVLTDESVAQQADAGNLDQWLAMLGLLLAPQRIEVIRDDTRLRLLLPAAASD